MQNQLLNIRFANQGITPNIVMRSSQLYTILKFIQDGSYGCFLFSCMLPQFPSVWGIPLDPPIPVNIGLVWKKGKYVNNHMQKFIDFIIEQYR